MFRQVTPKPTTTLLLAYFMTFLFSNSYERLIEFAGEPVEFSWFRHNWVNAVRFTRGLQHCRRGAKYKATLQQNNGHFVSTSVHVCPAVYVVNWVSVRLESCAEVKLEFPCATCLCMCSRFGEQEKVKVLNIVDHMSQMWRSH